MRGKTEPFRYPGDGNRVKGTVGGVTTTYVGNYFEWSGSTSTMVKYYYAGSTRIAMRTGSGTTGLLWLFGDHLNSTSRIANPDGTPYTNGEQRYKPWGEKRYPSGASGLPTTFRYTGQRQETGLGPIGGEGLYYYGARFYDPSLGRFVQADSLVLGMDKPQRWDRFGYVLNNPLRYTDPSGHSPAGPCPPGDNCDTYREDGNDESAGSTRDTDNGGCGGQGCDLGGNNGSDNDGSSEDGSTEIQLPSGNPTLAPKVDYLTNCTKERGCNQKELIAGASLVVLVDLIIGVGVVIITISLSPIAAGEFVHITEAIWVPANIIGFGLIFHSGCVRMSP